MNLSLPLLKLLKTRCKMQRSQTFTTVGNLSVRKKILAYIQEHDTEELSLTSLAEMYNISSSRLSTLIKKELGLSFSEYITARRMQKAKELLKDDSRSIEEIANAVGYHDYFYLQKFSKNAGNISKQIPEVSLNFSC